MEVVGDLGSAEVALREAEIQRPDVVLMDVRMPGMDGIQACRALRESMPESRVVMLTSYSDESAVLASIMAGASGYLLKNTGRADLLNTVRAAARGESLLDPEVTNPVLDRLRKLTVSEQAREVESLSVAGEGGAFPGGPGPNQPGDRGQARHQRQHRPATT